MSASGEPLRGTIVRDEGSRLIVDVGDAELACTLRKALRRSAGRRRKPCTVGDRVQVERSGDGAVIVAVEERTSLLSRPDPGDARREQILVANVDQVVVVAAAREPPLVPGLVDRFLAAVESRELDLVLAINKIDLDPGGEHEEVTRVYRDLGYPVLAVSAERGDGLEELRAILRDRTTTMLGHSGVGKSSLANALDPSLEIRVGPLHETSGLGTHTTTTVHLLRLPWGGYLVDTPGIRAFGLWNIDPRDLGFWFRDLARHVHDCRFNDCLHEGEPGCAVRAAVEREAIAPWRYESYRRILDSLRADTPEAW